MLIQEVLFNKQIKFETIGHKDCKIDINLGLQEHLKDGYVRLRTVRTLKIPNRKKKKRKQVMFADLRRYDEEGTMDLHITFIDITMANKFQDTYPNQKRVKSFTTTDGDIDKNTLSELGLDYNENC